MGERRPTAAAALKATAPLQTLGPDPQSASLMASCLHPSGEVNFQLFPVSPRQRAHMSPVLIAAAANGGKCVKLSGAGRLQSVRSIGFVG